MTVVLSGLTPIIGTVRAVCVSIMCRISGESLTSVSDNEGTEARICRIIILKTPRQGERSTLHLCTVVCQFIVNIVLERLDPFFALLRTGRELWRAE